MTGERTSDRAWWLPPFGLFVFVLHPLVATLLPDPLYDPGTGWHVAMGRYIAAHRAIPPGDLYSYTAAGNAWVDPYWLFEVVASCLTDLGGLRLFSIVCVLAYAALAPLLLRRMLRMGVGLLPAFLFTLCAYCMLLSHAFARPHLVTYLCFALILERLDRVQRDELPPAALWWIPLLMTLWCNMHPGFLAGLALAGIYAGVAALRFVVWRESEERRRTVIFGVLAVVMTLATLVNPYGPRLHASILQYLDMQALGYFAEFRPPNIQAGGIPVLVFERLVLLAVLLLARPRRAMTWIDAALIAFFLHAALRSIRHINLFAIVAAPILAREVSLVLDETWPALQRRLAPIAANQLGLRSGRLWYPLVCAAAVAWVLAGRAPFANTLDGQQLSRGAADFIAAHRDRFARMFNTDNLGGTLIYRFGPDLPVFVDDRVAVYGDDFILHQYLAVFQTKRDWQDVLDAHRVTAAVLATNAPCTTLFRASPTWEPAYADDLTTIFFRRVPAAAS